MYNILNALVIRLEVQIIFYSCCITVLEHASLQKYIVKNYVSLYSLYTVNVILNY